MLAYKHLFQVVEMDEEEDDDDEKDKVIFLLSYKLICNVQSFVDKNLVCKGR